jgi:glycosyltransferase involved in cell wall biosynthesis
MIGSAGKPAGRLTTMRILFYTPFKPLGHPHPSGDLVIATGLYEFLQRQGHDVCSVGPLRTRWIYWKPWCWPKVFALRRRLERQAKRRPADLWLTYHTYYKAPDLLGPAVARRLGLPYVIFQGIFATKHRRKLRTWPGYVLNARTLAAARHVFTNKAVDFVNLKRVFGDSDLTYVPPGIYPDQFRFDAEGRREWRRRWAVKDHPVVVSAAMFRRDVKSEGLAWMIRSCGRLHRQGARFYLAIAGEGRERQRLESLAAEHLPDRVRFAGRIPREHMHRFYSAGELFAFPGIRESLGMVYLEAQSCSLPVVAFDNGGIPEVVARQETGFLVPMYDEKRFVAAVDTLLNDPERRRRMGAAAAARVRRRHDLERNYEIVQRVLERMTRAPA